MADSQKDDDKKFNETLKRMLKTPPKPNEKVGKDKPGAKPGKSSASKKDR